MHACVHGRLDWCVDACIQSWMHPVCLFSKFTPLLSQAILLLAAPTFLRYAMDREMIGNIISETHPASARASGAGAAF